MAASKFGHSVEYYVNTYGRLSPEDVIQRYSRHYGIKSEQRKIENPINCQRCEFINEPKADYCEKCGSGLSIRASLDAEKEKDRKIKELEKQIAEMPGMIKEMLKQDIEKLEKLKV